MEKNTKKDKTTNSKKKVEKEEKNISRRPRSRSY